MYVNRRKLTSAHESRVNETILTIGVTSIQVINGQASRFVQGRSSRRDHVALWLQSVMMVGLWWRRSRIRRLRGDWAPGERSLQNLRWGRPMLIRPPIFGRETLCKKFRNLRN